MDSKRKLRSTEWMYDSKTNIFNFLIQIDKECRLPDTLSGAVGLGEIDDGLNLDFWTVCYFSVTRKEDSCFLIQLDGDSLYKINGDSRVEELVMIAQRKISRLLHSFNSYC